MSGVDEHLPEPQGPHERLFRWGATGFVIAVVVVAPLSLWIAKLCGWQPPPIVVKILSFLESS